MYRVKRKNYSFNNSRNKLEAQGNITATNTFKKIEGADGYMHVQYNNNWLIPTAVQIVNENTLSCILLNPFTSTKNGNASFVIIAYKNID